MPGCITQMAFLRKKLIVEDTIDLSQMSGFLSLGGFKDRPTRDKMRILASKLFEELR